MLGLHKVGTVVVGCASQIMWLSHISVGIFDVVYGSVDHINTTCSSPSSCPSTGYEPGCLAFICGLLLNELDWAGIKPATIRFPGQTLYHWATSPLAITQLTGPIPNSQDILTDRSTSLVCAEAVDRPTPTFTWVVCLCLAYLRPTRAIIWYVLSPGFLHHFIFCPLFLVKFFTLPFFAFLVFFPSFFRSLLLPPCPRTSPQGLHCLYHPLHSTLRKTSLPKFSEFWGSYITAFDPASALI